QLASSSATAAVEFDAEIHATGSTAATCMPKNVPPISAALRAPPPASAEHSSAQSSVPTRCCPRLIACSAGAVTPKIETADANCSVCSGLQKGRGSSVTAAGHSSPSTRDHSTSNVSGWSQVLNRL